MALKKWTTGDTITERSANKKSVRKGIEADLVTPTIPDVDAEIGDLFFNETEFCHQSVQVVSGRKRTNLRTYIAADSIETSVNSSTPAQVKDVSFVKSPVGGFSGNRIFVVAEVKRTGGGTGTLRVRKNGGGGDEMTLTTTSATYEIKTGSFDISTDGNGRITLEIFLDESGGGTMFNQELEVYGV